MTIYLQFLWIWGRIFHKFTVSHFPTVIFHWFSLYCFFLTINSFNSPSMMSYLSTNCLCLILLFKESIFFWLLVCWLHTGSKILSMSFISSWAELYEVADFNLSLYCSKLLQKIICVSVYFHYMFNLLTALKLFPHL